MNVMKIAPYFAVTPGVQVLPSTTEFHYQSAYPKNWDMSWGVPLDNAADALAAQGPKGRRVEVEITRSYLGIAGAPQRYVIETIPPGAWR